MKRSLIVILIGLAVGTASHFTYMRYREPVGTGSIEGQLAWMRTELRLSDTQFARIKELHEASHPRLRAMTAQLALMRAEFAEFERARRTTDRVDFVEFARFVETRREFNRQCADSTRRLVLASAEVMNPEQRERYLQLVSTVSPLGENLFN